MLVNVSRKVKTNIQNSLDFSVSSDSSKIFSMLASTLYTDKERAVVYEIGANCYDANPNEPFNITLPTNLDSHIRFRDFGPGLSEEDVYKLLTVFGASSKSNDNSAIGGYGIGAKSPAAVTDTWNIISYHNGTAAEYLVFIRDLGVLSLTKVREVNSEETGLEVIIPVAPPRFRIWRDAVKNAFICYPIKPIIKNDNLDWESLNYISRGSCWGINVSGSVNYHYRNKLSFVTTHRVYSVDSNKLAHEFVDDPIIVAMLNMPFIVDFPVGELQLSLSRESIQYTKTTVNNIRSKLEIVKREIVDLLTSHLACAKDGLEIRQKLNEMDCIFGKYAIQQQEAKSIIVHVLNGHFSKYNIKNLNSDIKHFRVPICGQTTLVQQADDPPSFGLKVFNGNQLSSVNQHFTCFKSNAIVFKREYEEKTKRSEYYIHIAISLMEKIKIVICDVRDSYARGKYSFDSSKIKFMLFAKQDIFPEELKRFIVRASDLPKVPKEVTIDQKERRTGVLTKPNVFGFLHNSLQRIVLPASYDKTKTAYINFTNSKSHSSIVETRWQQKRRILESCGWIVVGCNRNKPILEGLVHIDTALHSLYAEMNTDVFVNAAYSKKCLRSTSLSFDNTAKILTTFNFKSKAANSVWNKLKDKLDALAAVNVVKYSWGDYVNVCNLLRITPKEPSDRSSANIVKELNNTYPMFKFLTDAYCLEETAIEGYVNLVDSNQSNN